MLSECLLFFLVIFLFYVLFIWCGFMEVMSFQFSCLFNLISLIHFISLINELFCHLKVQLKSVLGFLCLVSKKRNTCWILKIITSSLPIHPLFFFFYQFICACLYWNIEISWVLYDSLFEVAHQLSTMIYTTIDIFYLTNEQLKNSPSRKDGISEATETTFRIYGCDLIQKSSILLRLYVVILFLLFFLIEMQLVHTILISPNFYLFVYLNLIMSDLKQ